MMKKATYPALQYFVVPLLQLGRAPWPGRQPGYSTTPILRLLRKAIAMNSKLTCLALTIFITLLAQDCFANQWAKTYGGDQEDNPYSIQKTIDGYIVAGHTDSFGENRNIWLLNLDQAGTVNWQKFYFYDGGSDEYARSIQQTADGGYIVAGYTNAAGVAGSNDFLILKLDHSGAVSWEKWFGGGGSDEAFSIQQTRYGGYIVMGRTFSFGAGNTDIWILKLDPTGNVTWQKTFGGGDWDEAYSIQQTTDDGYILAGYTESFGAGDSDMWILKLDSGGSVSWQKTYGGLSGDLANSIQQTADGGYIVAGYTWSFGAGEADFWILKLDAAGNVTWQKVYGLSNTERANSIQQTRDGGYIVAGYTTSFGAGYDFWILKLDADGNVGPGYPGTWQKRYWGNNTENIGSVQQTTDGGYIVAGRTNSFGAGGYDMWIIKIDSNGDVNNCHMIGTSASVDNTSISGVTSSASVSTPSYTSGGGYIMPENSIAGIGVQCFAPDWFPMDPGSQYKLNGVWGYLSLLPEPTHEFYAVGEGGTVIHFDGTNWSGTTTPDTKDLYGIWGSSEDDIYAVGENCTIFHYTGTGWNNDFPGLFSNNLKDVWGSSSGDVYAVGDGGKIARYFEDSWSEVTSPTTDNLTSIWGSLASDYHAVGEGGRIIRYDGTSWSIVTSPTSNDLNEVWGSASNNIYAVGKLGTIIHFNGTDWSNITESPTSATLKGIWGSSDENIFAVGEHGTILYYDGDSWLKMDSGSQDSLISTFGTLNEMVMIVGYEGIIIGHDGPSVQGTVCDACSGEAINNVTVIFDEGPQQQTKETDELGNYPLISSGGGSHELSFSKTGDYIPGEITIDLPNNSSIIDQATYLVPESPLNPHCISGTVTKTVKIGLGMGKEIKKGVPNRDVKLYQGGRELKSTVTDVGGNFHFNNVGAIPPGQSYICKVEPLIKASACRASPSEHTINSVPSDEQYDFELDCPESPPATQAYWDNMPSGTNNVLHGIWGDSTTDIFAVGDGGTILHYNGTWSPQTSGTNKNLKGVWGVSGSSPTMVYAVGEDGTVIRTTNGGSSWSPMTSYTSNGLNAIWGYLENDIFAVGDSGTIVHYNGTGWESMLINDQTVKDKNLISVWGSSGMDVYAMGNSHIDEYWKRTVLHYNGAWSKVEAGNGVTLMSSWGSGTNDITATGSFGCIIHYDGSNWKQVGGPTESTFNAMWGAPSGDIFAVGFDGVIAHYDGTSWDVRGKDKPDLFGIWGNSAIEVFAVGDMGTILSYDGDLDSDGFPDASDNCPEIFNNPQTNSDTDSHGDACDNCPNIDNDNQTDSDSDGLGNVCDPCPFDKDNDIDNDGICGDVDNCPDIPNGPALGTCIICDGIYCVDDVCIGSTCTDDFPPPQCEGGFCSTDQEDYDGDNVGDVCDGDIAEDTYPPSGNACVDICECEADFDGDGAVGANDVTTFLDDFGRNYYTGNPCANDAPCNGDFDCDTAVAANDTTKFLEDFGRNTFNNTCPLGCQTGTWCSY